MRESLSSGAPAFRQRTVSRNDILSRYRGSDTNSTRRVTDSREARRQVADTPLLSDTRRSRGGDTRSRNVRDASDTRSRDARDAGDTRSRDARDSASRRTRDDGAGDARERNRRTKAAREARAERDARRTTEARNNYLDSLNGQTGNVGAKRVSDVNSQGGGGRYDNRSHYNNRYWGYWGGYGCSPYSWFWSWPGYCYGYWWSNYWWYGGCWNYGYRPPYYWYGPYLPYGYSVIYQANAYYEEDTTYAYEDEPIDGEVYVEEVYEGPPVPQQSDEINRAADYYLTLGDRAFREGRYGDAVHFYAKAVEYAPEEGILYLILSDALFATGDYHYAGYSLRKAFELDPLLAQNVVDKHSFYADPAEFDRQLEVLEKYLEDHFLDNDARLVLAANYLFGGRPEAAAELLESAFSLEIKQSGPGQILLDSAKSLMGFGPEPEVQPTEVQPTEVD